jgi:subtilisin family serine protease
MTPHRFVMRTSSLSAFLLLALLVSGGLSVRSAPPAAAAESVHDTVLGARIEGTIAAGDVDAYRVQLLAGTSLRLRLSVSSGGGPGDGPGDGGPGGSGGGALPQLVALDPAGAELGRVLAGQGALTPAAATAGTYRFEVQAGAYAGGYELRIEGQAAQVAPEKSSSTVTVTSGVGTSVHVDAPAASSVEIEVRRRTGAAPHVDAVTDGLGRALTAFVRDARRDRVRLEAVPVAVAGGLDVTVSGAGGGAGTYEVRARVVSQSDRPASGGDGHEARRIVVQLAQGADPAAIALAYGWTLVDVEGDLAVFETPVSREGHEEDDAGVAEGHDGVVVASPDVIATLPEGSQANAPAVGSDLGRSSVDQQLAMTQIHAAAAHAIATGTGVTVAVLDGGVEAGHEFLKGRVLPGYDFVDHDADPSEVPGSQGYGHGTFVSSLILDAAPGATILPVRVLGIDGHGLSSDIAFGIEWAADHGADVMNLSFGTLGGNPTIAAAIRYALARGVTVVASTGNDGSGTVIDFPAALPGVVAVTALGTTGLRAPFANAGTATSIAAPGIDIVGAFPGGLYARWSGTSFAAALVSGGAALVLERTPAASPARVLAAIERRARPFRPTVPKADRRVLGAGVLDLLRLVR